MAVNKVVYGTTVLIDISDSTVTPETLAEGVVAYNAKGERIVGTHKCSGSSGNNSAKLGTAVLGQLVLGGSGVSGAQLGELVIGQTELGG